MVGNAYRVEIAWAVGRAETEIVTAHDVATSLAIPHNLVSKQLKDFVTIGIMQDVPGVEGQRFRYFRRLGSPYWETMGDLFDRLVHPDQQIQTGGLGRSVQADGTARTIRPHPL